MNADASPATLESFQDHLRRINLAGARLAYILAACLVPATSVLDWISVPERASQFLGIRLATSAVAMVGLALTYWKPLQRHPVAFGAGGPLLSAMAIEVMILSLDGPSSPYYAGLNLCILAYAVLFTCKWQHSLLVSGLVVLIWLIPAAPRAVEGSLDWKTSFSNLVFLFDTAVIAVASAVIRYRSAEREHRTRSMLAKTSSELSESLQQLRELDRLKNEFFANISHELRTPLTLILSPVEDLLTQPLTADLSTPLRIVRRNAQRLLRLIDDLLDLARLDGGGLRLNVADVNIGDLVLRVVEAARPAAEARSQTLEGPSPPSSSIIFGDPHRLEIILTNLIGNAMKFTPEGGRIAVSMATGDQWVEVHVKDTGPGIAKDKQERVFDRFYQVEGSERRSQGGAGIGLPLARSLAELHGGELKVESDLGQGSTFILKLRLGSQHLEEETIERRRVRSEAHPGRRSEDRPIVSIPPPSSEGPVAVLDEGRIQLARGRRARVLVAEDEKDLRDFITAALTADFDVIPAGDGEQALELVRKERPDLVLTDIMMPRLSGTDLCRAIKQDRQLRATPVIVLTARSSADSTLEGYSSGADDFVAKPFHTRVLIARVKAQLRLRALGLKLADQARLATASLLAAGIAHEVRNPLNALLNAARALPILPKDSPRGPKLLETISVGAQRIGEIVSVLEEQVRPADGDAPSVCDLDSGVASSLNLLDYRLQGIGVSYERRSAHLVVASGRELNQVILNLLDNAVKACPKHIWISLQRHDELVELSISDDGAGIPSDLETVIFEPFFTTRRTGGGTGLGLYLARRIVTEYGGDLSYRARDGGGSTFIIGLPAFEDVA